MAKAASLCFLGLDTEPPLRCAHPCICKMERDGVSATQIQNSLCAPLCWGQIPLSAARMESWEKVDKGVWTEVGGC